MSAGNRPYFYGIDLARFAAALMVACFHIGYSAFRPGSRGAPLIDGLFAFPAGAVFFWGSVGVQIFFVISGFVIANSANGSTPFRFLRSRAERLYPAVWICASITCAVWLISGAEPFRSVIGNYLHTLTLWPLGEWIDAPYWTIACEIVFYGIVFLLLAVGGFGRLQLFAIGMVAVGTLFWTLRLIADGSGEEIRGLEFFVSGAGRILPVYYAPFFGLGILLWLWRWAGLTPLGWTAALLAVAGGLVETLGTGVTLGLLGVSSAADLEPAAFVRALVWFAACAFVVLCSGYPAGGGMHPAMLRALRNIGLATYPLYLLHFALGVWTMRELATNGYSPWMAFAAALLVVCALSFAVTLYGEPVVRRGMRAAFDRLEAALRRLPAVDGILHRDGGLVRAVHAGGALAAQAVPMATAPMATVALRPNSEVERAPRS